MNNDVKQAFVKQRKSQNIETIKILLRIFDRMIPHEDMLGKDLCEFSKDEILNIYHETDYKCNLSSLKNYNSIYAKYTDFCINNYDQFRMVKNAYATITADDLVDIVEEEQVLKEDVLRDAMKNMLNVSDKFLCVAAREGMTREEIRAAKYEDIHGQYIDCYEFNSDDTERCYVRTIPISEEFHQYAYESSTTYELKGLKDNQIVAISYLTGDMIVKTRKDYHKNTHMKLSALKRKYQMITKDINNLITYDRLRALGIYNFISRMNITSVADVTMERREELREQYRVLGRYNVPKKLIRLIEAYDKVSE